MSASSKNDKNLGKDSKALPLPPKQNTITPPKPVETNQKLLNIWLKDIKNCYNDIKSQFNGLCQNQVLKDMRQKRVQFRNEFCHPLGNLYRQLPLQLTNFKFGLIQQYPQKNRLFFLQAITLFTAIKTISSSKINGPNRLLFSFRNASLVFLVGGLIVAPEIYNPWIKQ